ncbi:hypothetical protein CEUSTIGMA_g10142.t1 [Chlamydomonas eustigma]|uniref:U-box domain-containing protein n=1 Tax=Chlamydomonas eustigma TaxID=1157962 RepID=A0A250XI85_9CHLO|nr:hypothetical protein CEUSTIGMA_g10142.t1 [Chlamydomonas eustigma]|eukprot:GAX82716.1 hypothetical protein CEUSTIGMA_g10142.t1 [Chlamydomonas eustigma]
MNQDSLKLIEVPYEIQDPITHEPMFDPVLLVETGHSYNRASIQQWFQRGNRTCPKTNRKLKSLLVATNWTLRSLVQSWAQEHGIPVPTSPSVPEALRLEADKESPCGDTQLSVHSHPIEMESTSGELVPVTQSESSAVSVPESWTFFQGYDSPGGDLFRLQCDPSSSVPAMAQLLGAADKVPNCIAFNSSGHLKAALQPRAAWVMCDDMAAAAGSSTAAAPSANMQLIASNHLTPPEQAGLYVRSQCLPFIEAGCSSWDAAAASPSDTSGWTFFPGMDSPGGDICQAFVPSSSTDVPAALSSAEGSITSSSAIALVALAKPIVVAFNSNGWLKTLLQPMHGWVKWTTEAGKGLFVRNDVVMALISGVLAHVQGNQLAPIQLSGWTFFQGLDSLGGDVHWSWQHANNPAKLAEEACGIHGVIAFNTNGYIKTALRPRSTWTKVELWADKPSSGIYVHNSVLWKLLLA